MLSFVYPYLLWGLLALAIPVILHLLNRRNHQTLVFPVVKFLFRAQLPHEGRRRLQDLLLLLLRVLILGMAVLFLARPQWKPHTNDQENSSGKLALFLLDRSASFSGWNHPDKEQECLAKAITELSKAPTKWRVAAIASADGCVDEFPPSEDLHAIAAFARKVRPTHLAGNHRDALNHAVELLATASEKRLYLVSDFGRGDWGGLANLIPPDIKLHFLAYGANDRRNVGISSVRTALLPQGRRRVMVTVRNYSATTEKRTLTVTVGETSTSQEVQLGPLSQQRIGLSLADSPSQTIGMASLGNDDYQEDDLFSFSLRASDSPKALVIAEEGEELRERLSPLFTAKAMSAGDEAEQFEVVLASPMLLDVQECRSARVVFVLGCLDRLAITDIEMLHNMVNDGASLFVTPASGGSSVTLRRLREAGLMTVQSNGMAIASKNSSLGIGWIMPDSAIGRLCADWQETDLFLFPIFRHLRLQPEKPARTLIKSLDGLPLLIEKDCGMGKCHLFAFDFGTNWSAFALTSSFLPILRELCRTSIPEGFGMKRIICGGILNTQAGEKVDTSEPGVVFVDGMPVEIVTSPQEAMTESIQVDDLRMALYAKQPVSEAPPVADTTINLWKYAALALMFLLVLEGLVRCLGDAGRIRVRT